MHVSRFMLETVGRVLYLSKLRASALRRYDHGDTPDRLRASVVAADVAADVDVEDSPAFRADLSKALRSAGWRCVRVGGVRLWKGVKRK